MDYKESMGDEVIPNNKVIRPMNRRCYTKLGPVEWGENSIDRHCLICDNKHVIYVCMLILLKNDRGEEITRMVDGQWILRIFEATHIDARANRVQVTHHVDPWGCAMMEWLKNRMIKKYQDMKANRKMIATDDKIKSRAICTVRLIQRGLLEEATSGDYDFPLNQARVLDAEKYRYYR
jgi:hypothetical protein